MIPVILKLSEFVDDKAGAPGLCDGDYGHGRTDWRNLEPVCDGSPGFGQPGGIVGQSDSDEIPEGRNGAVPVF